MSRCVWICFLLFWRGVSHAQMSDSLYKALPDTLRPTNKLAVTDQDRMQIIQNSSPAFVYQFYDEFKAMAMHLEKSIESVKTNDDKMPYAQAIAGFYIQTSKRAQYQYWFKKVILYGEDGKANRSILTNAYLNVAISYALQEKQDSAIYLLHKATTIAIADKDSATLRNTYYTYIPIYKKLHLYHRALEYVNKYLNALPIQDKWSSTYTESIITKANIYSWLYNDERKPAQADSANVLILDVMKATKKEAAYWYHICYLLRGYLHYFMGDYPGAIHDYNLALLPQYTKPGSYQAELIYKAKIYRDLSLIQLGKQANIKELIAIKIPPRDFASNQELNRVLYRYYNQRADYQKALDRYILYKAYTDSSDVIGQRGKVFEAEQKYSVAQKEAAIAVLETKNIQAQVTRNTIVVIAILLLALLAILFYLRNKRQQAQRLAERQKLTDELHLMEQEMELERLNQQVEQALAIASQRKTISQNMHDEVSSSLVALRYRVADMKRTTPIETTRQVLDDIEGELNTVYIQTRDLLHRLADKTSQKTYDVFDLLENLTQRFSTGRGLQVHVKADRQLQNQLTPRQNAELYRVVKEAVANSLKHSGADRVDIGLYSQEGEIMFTIHDNGQGMSEAKGNGLGLAGMQQRLESLHGRLWIEPTAAGMGIRGSFPMNKV